MTLQSVFRVLLFLFGLGEGALGVRLLRRVSIDPPADLTRAVTVIGSMYVAIGLTAVTAAAFRSGIAFGVMAALCLAVPVTRSAIRRLHRP